MLCELGILWIVAGPGRAGLAEAGWLSDLLLFFLAVVSGRRSVVGRKSASTTHSIGHLNPGWINRGDFPT